MMESLGIYLPPYIMELRYKQHNMGYYIAKLSQATAPAQLAGFS